MVLRVGDTAPDSSLFPVRGDVLRKAFVLAVHEMFVHVLRITAGRRLLAHGFGDLPDVYGCGPTANAKVTDLALPGLFGKLPDFIAVAIERIQGGWKGPAVR